MIPLSLWPAIGFGIFLAIIGFTAMYLEHRDERRRRRP
jgi:hypothetical protein